MFGRMPYGGASVPRTELVGSDCRHKFLEMFASGEEVPFRAVRDSYTNRVEYYETMQANVLAEASAAYRSGSQKLFLDRSWNHAGEMVVNARALPGVQNDAASLAELQLQDNVVEFQETLFWVNSCTVTESSRQAQIKGFATNGDEIQNRRGPGKLRVHLFAGDYANRYRCSAELRVSPPPSLELEVAVLDPRRPKLGTYGPPKQFRTDVMPINEEQKRAVSRLKNRVELIHGPPGTGKSTTIFHVLSAHLPERSLATITCVTNQAIDAVAEKLRQSHETVDGLKILVLGNPGRVGRTAGQYTLENLCKRDELVVAMRWATSILQKTMTGLNNLQEARMERIHRPHKTSRLSDLQIKSLRAMQMREREWSDRAFMYDFLAGPTSAAKLTPRELHIEAINDIKRRMAAAVVKARKLRLPRRSSVRYPYGFQAVRREWDVAGFLVRVRAAWSRASDALSLAISTAPRRNVRRTRVVLCTIPSSYKVAQLKEEYREDFPNRLFMGILDEAAATSESYVPMLIRLGVENLVLLGDHKQLSPLVMAIGGDREIQDLNVDRSFMERSLDCGVNAHPLLVQYRMPSVLCELVSYLFYDGRLRTALAAPEDAAAAALGSLRLSSGVRRDPPPALRWVTINTMEQQVGTSKVNIAEVAQIEHLLQTDEVLKSTREKIMIITLYKPQMTLLQHTLERLHSSRLATNVQVVTVDAAQGSEAPHIILSPVRSNNSCNIGFAKNPRRLCVAISRAQKTLTVVGNSGVFRSGDANWRAVVDHFKSKGKVVPAAATADLQRSDAWEIARSKVEEMQSRSTGKGGGKGKGKIESHSFGGVGFGKGRGKSDSYSFGGRSFGLASNSYDVGRSRGFVPRQQCRYFALGRCNRGSACTFAHS